jgi:hypothetical protein
MRTKFRHAGTPWRFGPGTERTKPPRLACARSGLSLDYEEVVVSDDEALIAEVTIPELNAIEEAALIAKSNKALTFLAPPDLVLRLVRSHRATSIGAFVDNLEADDVEADLVARIQHLRRALQMIEWPDTPNRRGAVIAKRALHEDDLADGEMRAEYGQGVADLDDDGSSDDGEFVEPAVGDVWQDALGAKYRVLEVDEETYAVRLEAIAPVATWVEIGDLVTHAERVEPSEAKEG